VLARPGLDRLRDAVKGREVDRVLVTAPDRLARNYVHQMVLLEEWAQAGCAAAFLDRPMSDDPHDHLLLQIRGAVAEYERTLIAERMRRGRLAKLRAGVLLPWTYAPYGYRMSPDRPRDPHGVTLDPAEAAVVAELFALYREPGMSLMRLAMHLDARGVPTPSGTPRWSSATIRGILRNPIYTGQIYAQRTQYRAPTHRRSATHPIGRPHGTPVPQPADAWLLVGQVSAVVSQAHFDEVQAKLATNRSFARRNNTAHQYLLRALVSCGCCGLACTARAINGRNFYYLCNGKGHSTYSHRATCCPARHTPAGQLDELVWKDLCTLLAEPGPLAAAVARAHGGAWLPQELQARRETLRRAQAHLAQQLERLTDAYLRAVLPLDEYERRRRDLEQRMRALAGQEELLRHDVARRQQLAGVAASLEAFRARVQHGLAAATFEQRRQLVLLLIDRVIVTDAEVEIRYVLPTSPESEHVQFCHLRKDYFAHRRPAQEPAALLVGEGVLDVPGGQTAGIELDGEVLQGLGAAGQVLADGGDERLARVAHLRRRILDHALRGLHPAGPVAVSVACRPTVGPLVAFPPEPVAHLALQRLFQDQPCRQPDQVRALGCGRQPAVDQGLEALAGPVSGGYSACHGMLPGDPAPTGSPLSCVLSGRVHPNPLFQQSYAFTVAHPGTADTKPGSASSSHNAALST
jgi:site-specific DNA recombinase